MSEIGWDVRPSNFSQLILSCLTFFVIKLGRLFRGGNVGAMHKAPNASPTQQRIFPLKTLYI
ncbi:hypothetical protein HQ34_06880 [Porphyromonas cangingivalis]|nr:hypothetical protein HQ34_06880 [Porphyromonas cangingivalis]